MTASPAGNGELTGQAAIVTGAGRGIGRAIARALARSGAKVALSARSRDQLDETLASIQREGGHAVAFAMDVTDQQAVERMVREAERQLGTIDLLVNNAGINGKEGPIWEGPAGDWWRVLEVNLRGPFLCARAVLPGMVARRRGRIINVASNAGVRPSAVYSAYSVSKAGLIRLTDCLVTTAYGIGVFAISPGLVRTTMTQELPIWKDVPDSGWVPAERAGELCVFIATGKANALSGRYLHVLDDINGLVQRADEIGRNDLYALRLRK